MHQGHPEVSRGGVLTGDFSHLFHGPNIGFEICVERIWHVHPYFVIDLLALCAHHHDRIEVV